MSLRHVTLVALQLALAAILLTSCKSATRGPPEPGSPATWERESPLLPVPSPPLGSQADYAQLAFAVTPARVRLGRWLYFDRRLSAGRGIACADCHHPEHAFSERTAVSTGAGGRRGTRKAPSLINIAWPLYPSFFWDGRARTLAEQVRGPLENPAEMASSEARSVAAIAAVSGYRRAFREAFGDDRLDLARIAEAIAAYEATRMSGDSAYDRFDGGDEGALSAVQRTGRDLYYGKAACAQCHIGWNFTDSRFHNLGIGWHPGGPGGGAGAIAAGFSDPGRVRVSGRPEDTGAFKTPTLRDVSRHPPYMHDGSLATLRDVVEHYNRGGTPNPWLSPRVKPLHLDAAEVDALVAFLEALDGRGFEDAPPPSFPE